MELKNKKVLISGGSAGIGKSLIKELTAHGVQDIAVIGRRKDPLEALKSELNGVNFLTNQGNVAEPADLERALSEIKEKWGELDILINNAGVVSAGLLDELSDEDIINQVNVNVTGFLLLT